MTAVLPLAMQPQAGPSRPTFFQLDLFCPLALPRRPLQGTKWPFQNCGSIPIAGDEGGVSFLRRRYLETLFLSDLLAPIPIFVSDIQHLDPMLFPPLLLSLANLESRHRRTLLPLITALITIPLSSSIPEVKQVLIEEAITAAGLDRDEVDVVRIAVELRTGSRAVAEGTVIDPKRLVEEFEKREALLQIVLLFLCIPHSTTPVLEGEHRPSKRPRPRGRKANKATKVSDANDSRPGDNPRLALEMLMDRLSIWCAVADLGIGNGNSPEQSEAPGGGRKVKGKGREDEGLIGVIQTFWRDVLVPFFLPNQLELCSTFHLKIFAQPIPSELLPVAHRATDAKVTLHRERSSSRTLDRGESQSRAHSRPPSEAGSRASLPPPEPVQQPRHLGRSVSRTSDSLRRSRSRSTPKDPTAPIPGPVPVPKPATVESDRKRVIIRAPSGKDLFKGREVNLIRRTGSMLIKKKEDDHRSLARAESQKTVGLLGRKTSDPLKPKGTSTAAGTGPGPSASNNQARRSGPLPLPRTHSAGTLIFATPSKPRSNNPFGPRAAAGYPTHLPTPIQEEPSSDERGARPAYIAETPMAARTGIAGFPSGIAETPFSGRSDSLSNNHFGVAETPIAGRISDLPLSGLNSVGEKHDDDEDEDLLADLMVMTDDEGENEDEEGGSAWASGQGMIPETPARA